MEEAFPVFKFRTAQSDVVSPAADFAGDEETDDEDSFFDLVLKSPDCVAVTRRRSVSAEKDFQFNESPRDVFFMNSKPLYQVTLVRSTPKFRVFMLGFGKSSKCEKSESHGKPKWSPVNQFHKYSKIKESNRVSVTCRVEKRRVAGDNTLRSQLLKENFDHENTPAKPSRPRGALPKYLKLIRPLYLMVWKRQHHKTKLTESSTPSASPVPANLSPRRISDGGFKIAARRLRKSRSASTAVDTASHPDRRRDDSLLERHDGIQNAVLYCKKSYNSSSKELSHLFQSTSSCEEPKRCSI